MSTPLRHRLKFEVRLVSPFVMAGVEAAAVGVDAPASRDERGLPIIPADHLKGLLREAWRALEHAMGKAPPGPSARDIFGPEQKATGEADLAGVAESSPTGDRYAPARGRLFFPDLAAKTMILPDGDEKDIAEWAKKRGFEDFCGARRVTRIAIDDDTGAVEPGMLQVVELAAPLAAEAIFKGEAVFHGSQEDAEALAGNLRKALRIVPFFGGLRSAGFGEHAADKSSVTLEPGEVILAPANDTAIDGAFCVEFTLDRPYLVDANRAVGNLYVGAQVIPGGAIKGALAEMLKAAGKDVAPGAPHGEALAKMRIGHAFPLNEASVAVGRALPLSAMLSGKKFECALASATPGLIDKKCADFQSEWKDPDKAAFAERIGRPLAEIDTIARGHTRISAASGVAETHFLFVEAHRSCLLRNEQGEITGPRSFRFSVDFNGGDKDATRDIAALLSSRVDSLGKSRATMSCMRASAPPREKAAALGPWKWRVLLETPAILLDPDHFAQAKALTNQAQDENPVRAALEAYFALVLPGAKLERYFARRRLVGGYQAKRRPPGGKGAAYRPYSLFDAGSCFFLSADAASQDDVTKLLDRLARAGLPVCSCDMTGAALSLLTAKDWNVCPFVPENGYGEISVEDACFGKMHFALEERKPK